MDSRQEIIYQLYETRGEYYDMAADAAINERPFYLQKELDDINDQIKALEGVLIGEFLTNPQIETRYNPALLGGVRYQSRAERARSIALDNGKLRPYSQYPGRAGVVVNLEDEKIHGWKLE